MKLQLRLPALTKINQINQDWNLQFHFKYTVCSPVKTKYTHKNGRSSQNLLIKGTRLTDHQQVWTPKSRNLGSFLVWHIQMCVSKMTRPSQQISQQILGRRKCRCVTMKCTSHLERTKQHITTNTSFQQLSTMVEGLWSGSSCSDILCIPKYYSLKCEAIFVTTKAWLKLMYESKSATEWLKKKRIIVSKFRPQSNWNSVVGSWKSCG